MFSIGNPHPFPIGRDTHQLDPGHVLLPPEVLLVLWPHGGHHVVEVHEHMNNGVEAADDDSLFPCETNCIFHIVQNVIIM